MSAREKLLAATAPPPHGVEIFDLDDLIENAQCTTYDADEAMAAASVFIKAGIAGATAASVALGPGDLQALCTMLDLVKARTAAARTACTELALARHEGVR